MIDQHQTFRPTTAYWLKTWLPFILALLVIMASGIQRNMGTATLNRAISFSILISLLLIVAITISARQQITITSQGLFIQTYRRCFYWPWEQITAVHVYATGQESKPVLLINTTPKDYKFPIHAYAQDALEDAITAQVGSDLVGVGAYQETERIKTRREEYERNLKQMGESKKYVGGPVNSLLYVYALLLGIGFLGLASLFTMLENWFLAILCLPLALFGLLRPLSLSGEVYMNRDHIICKRPWQTHMIWWRDVVSVEVSYRYIIFRADKQCLVSPGLLFWNKQGAKKLLYVFTQQMKERQIYAQPVDLFSLPRNKNVRTNRFSPNQS